MTSFLNKALLALLVSAAVTPCAFAVPPHATAPMLDESSMDGDDNNQADVAVSPDGTISESSVSTPPIDGFGTLDQSKGALSSNVWKGSTRMSADPLLKEIRSGIANDTLRDMTMRLLMTQANPPQGNGAESWFSLRVKALIAIGADTKAEEMISSLPASMKDPSLFQLQTELQLARGEYDNACKSAQPGALPADTSDAFWRKLSILCQARAGKQEEAMVGIDVMREERHSDDPFFQEAVRKIGDKAYAIKDNPKQWTIVNVALLRLAGDTERLKGNMDAFPAVAVKYMAQDASLDVTMREKALIRGQQLGVLPGGEAKATEQPFSRPLASDVTTLVAALGSDKPVNDADNAVIARLALDEGGIQDSRRIQRLLTLMEPFGYRVPPEIWEKLYMHRERFDGDTPPASLVNRIMEAAQTGKHGEVIILAAIIADGSDVSRVSDLALLPLIKALTLSGFEKEARAVAYAAVKAYSAH